jgi:hypothetical protein
LFDSSAIREGHAPQRLAILNLMKNISIRSSRALNNRDNVLAYGKRDRRSINGISSTDDIGEMGKKVPFPGWLLPAKGLQRRFDDYIDLILPPIIPAHGYPCSDIASKFREHGIRMLVSRQPGINCCAVEGEQYSECSSRFRIHRKKTSLFCGL